jgi:hypothetical protein
MSAPPKPGEFGEELNRENTDWDERDHPPRLFAIADLKVPLPGKLGRPAGGSSPILPQALARTESEQNAPVFVEIR